MASSQQANSSYPHASGSSSSRRSEIGLDTTGKLPRGGPIETEDGCTFCQIRDNVRAAFKVYEDEHLMAFLDILPIREGAKSRHRAEPDRMSSPAQDRHLLVVPKAHYARVSQLPSSISSHLGAVLPLLCRSLVKALNNPDFNIVSNTGYAQIVHHVHFHIVPAPKLDAPSTSTSTLASGNRSGWASLVGREELDDSEGEELAGRIRTCVEKEVEKEKEARFVRTKL
ncbi:BQ2448_1340 [Microbotryum intermedium]|uniref:BQ2448_1340 protein n=1 Tax=Microbotryum intermedium TaxID=269621 RepID=A0A238FFY8_9BASI|nr:BQ2448_1340 [Microbotryum intermedium]